MKIADVMAQALRHAIEDRNALACAYKNEGPVAAEARKDIERFRALHERLKIKPARRMSDLMLENAESLTFEQIKARCSGKSALANAEASNTGLSKPSE